MSLHHFEGGGGGSGPAPVWDRAYICNYLTSGMQGLWVTTAQFGVLPWWDAALPWLNADDRQAVYAAKHASGDRHQIIELPCGPPLYDEEDGLNAYAPSKGFGALDWMHGNTAVDDRLPRLVEEVIGAGFVPELVLGGDDGQAGYHIAVQQLPLVCNALTSFKKSMLLRSGWDGVFYGYTPEQVQDFGARFRALWPDGYLSFEMSEGKIPLGEGPSDWTPTGRMKDFDVLHVEFNPDNLHQDSTWQISGRLLQHYHRPSDQPAGDDPNPPWYLKDGSPRGPVTPVGFEWLTYRWVRRRVSASEYSEWQTYLMNMGWANAR